MVNSRYIRVWNHPKGTASCSDTLSTTHYLNGPWRCTHGGVQAHRCKYDSRHGDHRGVPEAHNARAILSQGSHRQNPLSLQLPSWSACRSHRSSRDRGTSSPSWLKKASRGGSFAWSSWYCYSTSSLQGWQLPRESPGPEPTRSRIGVGSLYPRLFSR